MLTYEQMERYLHYQIEMNEFLRQRVLNLETRLAEKDLEVANEIIRLRESRPLNSTERKRIKRRDHFKCVECSKEDGRLHVHHKIPLNEGGTNKDDNLITLCLECHIKKHEGENVEQLLRKSSFV